MSEIKCNNTFYLIQNIQNIVILTCNQQKKLLRYFTFFLLYKVFEIQYIFYTYSTLQFGLAVLQMLNRYTWLVACNGQDRAKCLTYT